MDHTDVVFYGQTTDASAVRNGNVPTIHALPMSEELLARVIATCAEEHDATDMPVQVISATIGYGRHTHNAECERRCMHQCDDSDFIVELQYAQCGWRAIYGVTITDDREDIALWMD